jgi:hypothetical protein
MMMVPILKYFFCFVSSLITYKNSTAKNVIMHVLHVMQLEFKVVLFAILMQIDRQMQALLLNGINLKGY